MNQKKEIVDKEKIVNILKQPQQLNSEDIHTLEKWLIQYPYFQSAHILIAKLANDNNSPNKEIKLNYAAIYSPDRGVLKRIILNSIADIPQYHQENSTHWQNDWQDKQEVEKNLPKEYPKIHEPISEDWKEKNESYNQKLKDEYLIKKDNIEIKKEEEKEDDIPVPEVNQQLVDEVLANLEKARKLKKEYQDREEDEENYQDIDKEKTDQHETPTQKEDIPQQEESDNISASQPKDLIDIFIENEKNLGKIQPKLNVEPQIDLSEKSTSLTDDMVSENLASILRKQGKKDKAIDIYKKLIWKFPQKRAYFASLIEELKNN